MIINNAPLFLLIEIPDLEENGDEKKNGNAEH